MLLVGSDKFSVALASTRPENRYMTIRVVPASRVLTTLEILSWFCILYYGILYLSEHQKESLA